MSSADVEHTSTTTTSSSDQAAVTAEDASTTTALVAAAAAATRPPVYPGWHATVAGGVAGLGSRIITAPLDLIRTRLQVWGQVARTTTSTSTAASAASSGAAGAAASGAVVKNVAAHQAMTQMLRDIIKTDGIRGCFRGLGATLVTVPTFWGVYCEYLFMYILMDGKVLVVT